MEKKIANYFVNWSICNISDQKIPYAIEVEINNAIHTYARNYYSNQDYNKARAYEYLHKILLADIQGRDNDAFINILTENADNTIVWAGGLADYQEDYIIVAIHYGMDIAIYAFRTTNECNTFEMYEQEEEV